MHSTGFQMLCKPSCLLSLHRGKQYHMQYHMREAKISRKLLIANHSQEYCTAIHGVPGWHAPCYNVYFTDKCVTKVKLVHPDIQEDITEHCLKVSKVQCNRSWSIWSTNT